MTFSMTPVAGFPPVTPDDFPNFIQFQEDGVNLGGPDADTVNFTGNVSVTRGEGENAGVITVEVPTSSSGSSPTPPAADVATLVVRLGENVGLFGGSSVGAAGWESSVVLVESEDATWDSVTGITFEREGLYEVLLQTEVGSADEGPFPDGSTRISVTVQNGGTVRRTVFRDTGLDNYNEFGTDLLFYNAMSEVSGGEGPGPRTVHMSALSQAAPSQAALFNGVMITRWLGDVAP